MLADTLATLAAVVSAERLHLGLGIHISTRFEGKNGPFTVPAFTTVITEF